MAKKETSFLEDMQDKYPQYLKTEDKPLTAISTGSISLDYATGIGGIPRGRFTEIYGAESGGKTTLALSISKTVVDNKGKVLYIDAENGLDWTYIKAIVGYNVTKDNFYLVQPETAEQSFTIAEKGLRDKEFDLIVVDSVAALASNREMEAELEGANVAEISRILSRFSKRNPYSMRNADTAFVFINQVRDKIGSYVPMLETPGGHALKHICSLRIMLNPGLSKDDKIYLGDVVIGTYTKFTIKKSKVGAPGKSYAFPIMYGKGIDTVTDTILFGATIGAVMKSGAWYSYYDVDTNEEVKLGQGIIKSVKFLRENKEVLDKITKMIYNFMQLNQEATGKEDTGDE
jgi:recombination protein RecA